MNTDIINKQREAPSRTLTEARSMCHIQTTSITKFTSFDGYNFSLTIIKPLLTLRQKCAIPVFLFVPNQPYDFPCISYQEQIASELVTSSGQAAAILNPIGENSVGIPIFELFAALKWIACHGSEAGINGSKMSIVGLQHGANLAAVLSQMALYNDCPDIGLQILIDPQFFISQRNTPHRPITCRSQPTLLEHEWLNMKSIYNLPLDSKIAELIGLPPTLIQLSKNTGNHCELEYYCAKLLDAGTELTYITYDERNDELREDSILPLSRTLLVQTAAELRKVG